MAEKWLVTGGTGQVGLALRRNPPPGVEIVAPGRLELNLEAVPPLEPWLDGVSAIVNCGAYTAVDKAESEAGLAAAINTAAPGRLGEAAARAGIPMVHVSTDYVFGAGQGPWREDSPSGLPLSIYGQTKAAGERAVRAAGARHAIVRTAWVISADGSNFVKTMLRLGAERDTLRVVADQRGSPTHAGDLAAALAAITRRFVANRAQASGVWHCANAGETTWHGLASQVFAAAARLGLKVPAALEAITTADYPVPAIRPADSRLDCAKLAHDYGISLRPWQEAVDEIVGQLVTQGQLA
jgi:dTDP-4-dehydrorhamnose reductase